MDIRDVVFSANLKTLDRSLRASPSLANDGISLPDNPAKAHPLHRICDGVADGLYSEETGIEMAKIFLKNGADLNSVREPKKDSPLTAACSLKCDKLAILYIGHGADIAHQGCLGGTALHWASWCGRDIVVEKLLTLNPEIDKLCIDFKSTPLFWAIHGYKFGDKENRHHQIDCARMLLAHGADPGIPNFEGLLPADLLEEDDVDFHALFEMR